MHLRLNHSDGVPIYLQIVNQVKYLVSAGRIAAGDELPPIRALAEKLLINPNTVARAYRELEVEGIVEKRSTAGTYVTETRPRIARQDRQRILNRRADALLTDARQMEVGLDDVIDVVRKRDRAMDDRSNQP
jgi:GntR family transcriptional regulator